MRSASFANGVRRTLRGLVQGVGLIALLFALAIAVQFFALGGDTVLVGEPRVIDGDTIEIADRNIRLAGLDAPERSQLCRDGKGRDYACGRLATDYLSFLTRDGQTTCRGRGKDRYGRVIGDCRANGVDLSEAMIRRGWAVAYLGDYGDVEAEAMEDGVGLWAGEFVRPADWRKARRSASVTSPFGVLSEIALDLRSVLLGERRLRAPGDE